MKIYVLGDSHTPILARNEKIAGPVKNPVTLPDSAHVSFIPLGVWHLYEFLSLKETDEALELTDPNSNHPHRRDYFKSIPLGTDDSPNMYVISAPLHSSNITTLGDWRDFNLGNGRPEAKYHLSSAVFEHVMLQSNALILKVIESLRKRGQHVFSVEPPMPFWDQKVIDRRGEKVEDSIGSDYFIFLTRYFRDFMESHLNGLGVPSIRVPSCTVDSDGYSLKEFKNPREDDLHHGNSEFGDLMMREILDRCATLKIAAE